MEAAPFQSVPKRTPVKAAPECLRDSSTAAKRNVFAATIDVAWPAAGSNARGGRNTEERLYFPQCNGI